jgi:putative drug exporter of the RND superfamily
MTATPPSAAPRHPQRSLRRPRVTLAVAMACVAVLGAIGLDVKDHLEPTSLEVAGTTSARGDALLREHFGESSPFVILLRGPAAALDRQGPELVRALRRHPAATAISPWGREGVGELRRGPRRALVLVDFRRPLDDAVRHTVPALERVMREHLRPPVVGIQSGFASISRALEEESLSATKRAELFALPLLIVVLLVIFRSVIAAAIPLAFGVVTVLAGRGVLVLLSDLMRIDALSLVVCTMMGLALGVDYSLLIVSRFREELRAGGGPLEAARRTRGSAGRTTAFAGATLFAAILASAFVQAGGLLVSFATALVVVTAISVVIAALVLPALLALLGNRIDAGRIGWEPRWRGSGMAGAVQTALRRPAVSLALIAVPLLLLASPALALSIGSPGVDELPTDSIARQSAEAIDELVGPGWEAPFVLTAATRQGPITTPRRLALLARWQRRIAARPDVRAVIGPAPIAAQTRPLRRFGERLSSGRGAGELTRLGPGLRRASAGVGRLRAGVERGAAGSALLGEGSGRAEAGAALLAHALGRAGDGGERAARSIDRLAAASKRLSAGRRRAEVAGLSLSLGVRALFSRVGGSLARARQLSATVAGAADADPASRQQASQAASVVRGLASTREELRRLGSVADSLNQGLDRLASGSERVEAGAQRLATAASGLGGELDELQSGAQRLAGGLEALQGGADSLQQGLAEGFHRSRPLQTGLARAADRASGSVAPLRRGMALRRSSPHLFDSGYFVLSALDGAPPLRRALSRGVIDLDGGQAVRLHVIPTSPFNSAGSRATGAQLLADAEQLAEQGGLETGVSGGAATLNDYGAATQGRLPVVIATVVIVTLLMLIAILRAPLLALLTLGLNLFSVAAAIGIVGLICMVPADYPLGGHHYIDTVGAAAIFGITFGLSIDYAVFLIARMRERWEETGDNASAVAYGLEKTAGVITGAAAIMAVVFLSFALAPIATVSQMGVGLFVAILLDATVVRIVLLPALMLLLGERVWHVPAALDRLLPELNVHGGEPEGAGAPA